jgi:hypothetical protein
VQFIFCDFIFVISLLHLIDVMCGMEFLSHWLHGDLYSIFCIIVRLYISSEIKCQMNGIGKSKSVLRISFLFKLLQQTDCENDRNLYIMIPKAQRTSRR